MPRPRCKRRIGCEPAACYYKPAGVPLRMLQEERLTLDELEALRLADAEGMYQEKAATAMDISRATFSRLVAEARRKVARALVHGYAVRIEGGPVDLRPDPPVPMPDVGRPCGRGRHGWRGGR